MTAFMYSSAAWMAWLRATLPVAWPTLASCSCGGGRQLGSCEEGRRQTYPGSGLHVLARMTGAGRTGEGAMQEINSSHGAVMTTSKSKKSNKKSSSRPGQVWKRRLVLLSVCESVQQQQRLNLEMWDRAVQSSPDLSPGEIVAGWLVVFLQPNRDDGRWSTLKIHVPPVVLVPRDYSRAPGLSRSLVPSARPTVPRPPLPWRWDVSMRARNRPEDER